MVRRLASLSMVLTVYGCGDLDQRFDPSPTPFVLPDAGRRDARVEPEVDAGTEPRPFVCPGGCPDGQACGCIGARCGCQIPARLGEACDPLNPDTCGSGACVIARVNGADRFLCTDGSEGSSCSKRDDRCATQLGCICLTPIVGGTDCRCRGALPSGNLFCDPLEPEATCPGFECRRVEGPSGAYFVCANGVEGEACDPRVPICATSLGCACPFIEGNRACACAEPGGAGEPCDGFVDGACTPPLICVAEDDDGTVDTVCRAATDASSNLPCDPDPLGPDRCPPGEICAPSPGGHRCRRI